MKNTHGDAECSAASDCYAVRDLSQVERTAFLAWFRGGLDEVTEYANRPNEVFWGKHECQQVAFREFWLKKMVVFGWFTVERVNCGTAKGMVGAPEFVTYKFHVTEVGWDALKAYYHTA